METLIRDVSITGQFETTVPGPDGANRFITIIGSMRVTPKAGDALETFTYLAGPILQEHELLGASCLTSIAAVGLKKGEFAECSLKSEDAAWDETSGQVKLSVELVTNPAVEHVTLVFSLTMLAAV